MHLAQTTVKPAGEGSWVEMTFGDPNAPLGADGFLQFAVHPIFHDEAKARAYLEGLRWADGRVCPHCGEAERTSFAIGKKDEEVGDIHTVYPSNSQTSTICLGKHLVVHVVGSAPLRSIIRRWRWPPSIDPLLAQIWPIKNTHVSRPPLRPLSDTDPSAGRKSDRLPA